LRIIIMSSTINYDVESMTKRIEGLSPERRSLLDRLLKAKGVGTTSWPNKIQRRGKSDFTPLSFAQERMWVLHHLDPTNPSYIMPDAVRLQGPLDVSALRQSFEEIVRRHDVLRTTFRMTERGPEQVVAPEQAISQFLDFAVVDCSEMPANEAEAAARSLAAAEAVTTFDLSQGPTLRIRVIRLNAEDHIILFTMHHIASDMWSLNIFAREIMMFYEAFSQGKPGLLPELPIQYADFAIWQRELLQGETYEEQLSYWKRHLKGGPALLELPTDRPRPRIQTFRGSSQRFVLTDALSKPLLALTRQEDVTLFMTLLTAFYILLHRYTGQKDIVLGTPMAGRNQSETEGLIGFFINTLALRTQLSGDLSFRQLLKRVREVVLGASEHQDFPFEKLVEELQPERSLSYSPLFQVMFALQSVRGDGLRLPGLTLVPVPTDAVVAKFDLTLFMAESGGEIEASFEYNTDLFDLGTINRMIGHFERLLQGIIASPDQHISELPFLSPAEEEQQILEWNETARTFPATSCLHHLFEEQVRRTPHAPALRCGTVHLSYAELNERANQLARYMISRGLSTESLVAVCLPRSAEMVISLLAVLKAGGAYLPLDLSSPPRRLKAILSEAQPRLLVTVSEWRERLPVGTETSVLCLDREWSQATSAGDLDPAMLPGASVGDVPAVSADNLAYVIYTSGSTGQPKGAMITHRGVVNYLSWCQSAYPLGEGSGAVVHSPIGFDLTVTSLYGPLVSGGCVHLLEEDEGVEGLAKALLQPGQTYSLIKITPAHLEVLSRLIDVEGRVRTRAMVIGGEALYGNDVRSWQARAPEVRLINEYGPTETVVGCCVFEVGAQSEVAAVVPIGRPIANTRLYILNEEMRLLPVGVAGELYVGGEGVGRGYLKKPEATAERYVPDRFSEEGGGRLYRTGDLARYREDGAIEYVGRTDHQVKVRGYRIELGEIEAVLRGHELVQEAIVILKGEAREEQRLVAYLVPAADGDLTITTVRDYLKSELPAYMIPSAIVLMDALPLTLNGKIDYRELPNSNDQKPQVRHAFVAPRNLVELYVAEIWQDVLKVQPIGATDNFFDLGGHSMLGLRVSARIYERFGYDLPLSAFFEGGTVEHLAALIQNKTDYRSSHLVALQGGSSGPPIFFVHPIGGGVVCYAYLARHLGAEQPVYGLQALEKDDPHTQVETMAASYIDAMRQAQPQGPYLLGGWSFGAYVAFEMANQLKRAGQEIELLAVFDNGAPGVNTETAEDDPVSGEDPVALARILESFANLKEPLPIDEDYLRQLGPDEQLLYIMEQAKQARIMPQELSLHQVKRSLHNFKSRGEAARSYVAPRYPGKVTLFRCAEIQPQDKDVLAADPGWGWSRISSEPVELHIVAGSHESMVAEPDVLDVAAKLKECIARIERE
jgi:amino acid adenylation domain-containing protein